MAKLLVVDDDLRSARVIAALLRRAGYSVEVAGGGAEALERARTDPPDLMVLDYEMPEVDGEAVLGELTAPDGSTEFPILILTGGRVEAADEAYSLGIGAVDYVRKGGDTGVLMSRIGAALRKHPGSGTYLRRGRLLIDTVAGRVWLGGRPVGLEHRPFQVLAYLAQREGAVVEKVELLEAFWGSSYKGFLHSVEQSVWAVRKGLGERAWIEAVHRRGYRFQTQR
ncbi:MAG: response regulator transcription factor [Chloroflexota bacterium]